MLHGRVRPAVACTLYGPSFSSLYQSPRQPICITRYHFETESKPHDLHEPASASLVQSVTEIPRAKPLDWERMDHALGPTTSVPLRPTKRRSPLIDEHVASKTDPPTHLIHLTSVSKLLHLVGGPTPCAVATQMAQLSPEPLR